MRGDIFWRNINTVYTFTHKNITRACTMCIRAHTLNMLATTIIWYSRDSFNGSQFIMLYGPPLVGLITHKAFELMCLRRINSSEDNTHITITWVKLSWQVKNWQIDPIVFAAKRLQWTSIKRLMLQPLARDLAIFTCHPASEWDILYSCSLLNSNVFVILKI